MERAEDSPSTREARLWRDAHRRGLFSKSGLTEKTMAAHNSSLITADICIIIYSTRSREAHNSLHSSSTNMCIVVFTFIHNGLYMIKQNLTLNSLMWGLLMLTPITCKHCIDHHVVNNVCPTCDLILPSSPLQLIQDYSQVCTVCSHQ